MTHVLPIDAFALRPPSEPVSTRDGTGDAFDRLLDASFGDERVSARIPEDQASTAAPAETGARDRAAQTDRADHADDHRATTRTAARETRSPINDRGRGEPASSEPPQNTRPIDDQAPARNAEAPGETFTTETSKTAAAGAPRNTSGADAGDAAGPASSQTTSDTAVPDSETTAGSAADAEPPAAGIVGLPGIDGMQSVIVGAEATVVQSDTPAAGPSSDTPASTRQPPASSDRPASAGTIREGQLPGAGFAPELRDSDLPAAARAASDAQGKVVAAALRTQPATIEAGVAKDASGLVNFDLTGRRQNPDGSFSSPDGAPTIPGKPSAGGILGQTAARFGLALNIMALPGSTGSTLGSLISPELLSALNTATTAGQTGEAASSGQPPGSDVQTATTAVRPAAVAPAAFSGGAPLLATAIADLHVQGDGISAATPATGTTHGAPAHAPAPTATAARFTLPTTLPVDQVAVFIARAAQPGSDRFTIRLHPAELGRVEVSMDVARDGRVTAVLTAEKQHTLDLLQRDARVLERALTDSGLQTDSGSLSFSLFDHGNGADQALDEPVAAPLVIAAEDDDRPSDAIEAMAKVHLIGNGPGVDIRI